MAVILAIIPIGIVIGLIAKAAKHIPKRYIDIMVMFQDRHTSRIVDQIIREQVEAAEEFHKGYIQGVEDANEEYRGGKDH